MEYAQARIQARFGRRPEPALWRELRSVSDSGALLAAIQGSVLAPWTAGIEARSDLHQIDRALRERLRAHIREVAAWLPPAWRDAALWILHLPHLPAVMRLLAGERALAWMWREPALQPAVAAESRPPQAAIAASAFAFLLPGRARRRAARGAAPAPSVDARTAWLNEWRERWPAEGREGLERLVATVLTHLERFARARVAESGGLRALLEQDLRRLFRRFALQPAAAFAYLALAALDLERLRAELARCALARRGGRAA